jgi:hypothetical protein
MTRGSGIRQNSEACERAEFWRIQLQESTLTPALSQRARENTFRTDSGAQEAG